MDGGAEFDAHPATVKELLPSTSRCCASDNLLRKKFASFKTNAPHMEYSEGDGPICAALKVRFPSDTIEDVENRSRDLSLPSSFASSILDLFFSETNRSAESQVPAAIAMMGSVLRAKKKKNGKKTKKKKKTRRKATTFQHRCVFQAHRIKGREAKARAMEKGHGQGQSVCSFVSALVRECCVRVRSFARDRECSVRERMYVLAVCRCVRECRVREHARVECW